MDLKNLQPNIQPNQIPQDNGFDSNLYKTSEQPRARDFQPEDLVSGKIVSRVTGLSLADTVTVEQGGTGAITLTGILKGNGTSAVTAIVPLSGTKVYYVSDSSGGAVNRKLTFVNGVLTSET